MLRHAVEQVQQFLLSVLHFADEGPPVPFGAPLLSGDVLMPCPGIPGTVMSNNLDVGYC